MTNLDYLILGVGSRETVGDILQMINYKRQWKLNNLDEISDRIEYSYGGGMRGLCSALYNLVLHIE